MATFQMESLPSIEGPKLAPFFVDGDTSQIRFVETIADGYDGIVWKIAIKGKLYALKLFIATEWDAEEFEEYGETVETQQTEPFYCECRVYGRLKEMGMEDLAVKAYGYVSFDSSPEYPESEEEKGPSSSSADDEEIYTRCDPTELREDDDVRPIRGIIKELVEKKPCFTPSMIPQMMKDVESLHRLGIFIGGDIRDDAYLDGKLVDFSRAWTVPHYYMDKEKKGADNTAAFADFETFDRMIDVWNEENPSQRIWERFRPNREVLNRLRSACPEEVCVVVEENATGQKIFRNRTRRKYKPWRTWGKRFNPVDYDWKAALKQKGVQLCQEGGTKAIDPKGRLPKSSKDEGR